MFDMRQFVERLLSTDTPARHGPAGVSYLIAVFLHLEDGKATVSDVEMTRMLGISARHLRNLRAELVASGDLTATTGRGMTPVVSLGERHHVPNSDGENGTVCRTQEVRTAPRAELPAKNGTICRTTGEERHNMPNSDDKNGTPCRTGEPEERHHVPNSDEERHHVPNSNPTNDDSPVDPSVPPTPPKFRSARATTGDTENPVRAEGAKVAPPFPPKGGKGSSSAHAKTKDPSQKKRVGGGLGGRRKSPPIGGCRGGETDRTDSPVSAGKSGETLSAGNVVKATEAHDDTVLEALPAADQDAVSCNDDDGSRTNAPPGRLFGPPPDDRPSNAIVEVRIKTGMKGSTRQPWPMFDVIAELSGLVGNKAQAGRIAKLGHEIEGAGITPEELRDRLPEVVAQYASYRQSLDLGTITACWAWVKNPPKSVPNSGKSKYTMQVEEQNRIQQELWRAGQEDGSWDELLRLHNQNRKR